MLIQSVLVNQIIILCSLHKGLISCYVTVAKPPPPQKKPNESSAYDNQVTKLGLIFKLVCLVSWSAYVGIMNSFFFFIPRLCIRSCESFVNIYAAVTSPWLESWSKTVFANWIHNLLRPSQTSPVAAMSFCPWKLMTTVAMTADVCWKEPL